MTTMKLLLLLAAAVIAQAPDAPAPADPLLTPDQAVRIGLEHNHSLSLARDEAAIARNNRQAGIGPFLPDLSANARHNGVIGESENVTSVGASAGLIIFDGFQSWHAYQRLKTQEASARLDERLQIEATLESILAGYFGIVQQERRLDAIRELLAVSEERARLAQARMEVGAGSRLEQLQALSDLNADSASFLSQTVAIREAKVRLNLLLGRDPQAAFQVQDSIPLEAGLPVGAWRDRLGEANAGILRARAQRKAASHGVKEARSGYYPDLNASLSYGTLVEDLDQEPTLTYGLSLSVPLFDRLRTRRDVGNARLALRQGETRLRQQEQQIRGEFEQAAERHASGLRRVALEERNLEVSRLQAEAARERYRLGASSPLEFRDAQTRLLDSQSRLAAARQETKAAELALKRLAGALVREAPSGQAAASPSEGEGK
jgi:outer membrane protein TolC